MSPERRRTVARLGALVGAVVLVAGCRVDTRVEVTMRDDGSGTLRSTITLDADAVQKLGGAGALAQTVPLGDLRSAGWTISKWATGARRAQTITLSHRFADQRELTRRVLDLAGPKGVLQNPVTRRDRNWFSSHDALSIVVDLRAPPVDLARDPALAARLRAAGVDPATLQTTLSAQLRDALHVSVVLHTSGGSSHTYVVAPGRLETLRVADGGTDWDHVVRFGIGAALAALAVSFFSAAGVGARRNRRRAAQRVATGNEAERAPSM
jgi:hypothetical protein